MEIYTQEHINFIKSQVVEHGDSIAFYFVPSARLRELILKGVHPNVVALPKAYVELFLQGKAVVLENKMVIDYLEGRATSKNIWLLNLGEIRVVTNTFKVQKTKDIEKYDDNWKNPKEVENKKETNDIIELDDTNIKEKS